MSLHESRDFDVVRQPFIPKLELEKQIKCRYNKQMEDVLDHYIIPSKIKCIKPQNTAPSYCKRFMKKSFKKNNTFETSLQTSISPLFVES